MSDSQSAREKLKELASELNIDVDDLVQNSLSADVPVAPPPPADIPLSDAAIRAAICDSYTVRESWAADLDRSILERSQLIMVDGRRRLRLSESARGSILQKAASTQADRLRALLDEAPAPGTGHAALPATQAATQSLHSILKGQTLNLSGAPPAELRAAVTALDRLREAPLPAGTPSLAEAQRLLERAELLEPLRIMVGATGSWDTRPEGDRFA